MFDHVEFAVRNVEPARVFYRAVLAPLDWVEIFAESGSVAGYGSAGGPVRMLISAVTSERAFQRLHIAFAATSAASIRLASATAAFFVDQ